MTNNAERPLKVAVDATPLLGARTGIGEFCARLLDQLANKPEFDVGAFAMSRAGRNGLAALLPAGVRPLGWPGPGVPARLLHALWAKVGFPTAEMMLGKHDVVHGTNFVVPPARAATVVTVHDLSPLHYPQWSSAAARAYPDLVRAAIKRGAWVHADSAFVAGEAIEMLGASPDRARVVHLGVHLGAAHGDVGLSGLLPEWATSYVLAMSRVEPRKDFPTLVRAFSRLAAGRPGLALVIAGPPGTGSAQLDEAVAASPAGARVVRLGWVSDEQRHELVRRATVFAYPSLYEGFGLPPLQAMAAGTPVVATRCGAIQEVLGDAARLVEVGDDEALAGALEELVDDPAARQELSSKGRAMAARYSWEACADGLASLYREAFEAAPTRGAG